MLVRDSLRSEARVNEPNHALEDRCFRMFDIEIRLGGQFDVPKGDALDRAFRNSVDLTGFAGVVDGDVLEGNVAKHRNFSRIAFEVRAVLLA